MITYAVPSEVRPQEPSDSGLFITMATLLAAMPGPRVGPPLSRLFANVCSAYCPTAAAARARRLEQELAEYLHAWRVLRSEQLSPAALDAWAASTPLVFLRAALTGCAKCHRTGGENR